MANEVKYNLDLSKGKGTKILCGTVLLSERNYHKYKKKLAKKLERNTDGKIRY